MQYPSFPMYAHRLFLMHVCRRLHAGAPSFLMQVCRRLHAGVPSFLCLCTAFLLLCVLSRSSSDTVLCMALRQIVFFAHHDRPPHDSEVTEILRQGFRKLLHFAFLICYTSSRLYIYQRKAGPAFMQSARGASELSQPAASQKKIF